MLGVSSHTHDHQHTIITPDHHTTQHNSRGKKAKRKAREKQLEEAKRLAHLQKKRELKAAGIELRQRFHRRKGINYSKEVAFEMKPAAGFYDTGADEVRTQLVQKEFRPVTLEELEGKRHKVRFFGGWVGEWVCVVGWVAMHMATSCCLLAWLFICCCITMYSCLHVVFPLSQPPPCTSPHLTTHHHTPDHTSPLTTTHLTITPGYRSRKTKTRYSPRQTHRPPKPTRHACSHTSSHRRHLHTPEGQDDAASPSGLRG